MKLSLLLSILRAAHCRSTHHYFAIDALSQLETPQGKLFANLLLKYHDEYLVGAKAPDSSFRDFTNHVLHIEDGAWGGAVKSCESWWEKTIQLMNEGKWKKAAFACGVLSHYFTDPIMPLHTGQSEAEAVIHRPMEWSICKSYNEIYALALSMDWSFQLPDPEATHWLGSAVTDAARIAHTDYAALIADYDVEQGSKNPPAGLNDTCRRKLARLFTIAIGGWSQILNRLADETTEPIPEVSLGLTTLLASIDVPLAWVVRKISDTNEQLAVKRIFAEYQKTGTVTRHLPAEYRVVQTALQQEQRTTHSTEIRPPSSETAKAIAPSSLQPEPVEPPPQPEAHGTNVHFDSSALSPDADVVDAPSIGPKTAKRFYKIGVGTVGDLLAGSPDAMAEELGTRWITADLIREWQDQARLVCEVAPLCGYKSQLLVAVNCRTREQLSSENAYDLSQRIDAVCETLEGKRILRRSRIPSKDDVAEWITAARQGLSRAA